MIRSAGRKFSLEVSWPSGVVGGEWPGNSFLIESSLNHDWAPPGKVPWLSHNQMTLRAESFFPSTSFIRVLCSSLILNWFWFCSTFTDAKTSVFPFLSRPQAHATAWQFMKCIALVRTHSSWRRRGESCVTKSIAWLQTWILAQLGKRLCQYSIELASCLSQSDHLSCNNVYEWWYLPPS